MKSLFLLRHGKSSWKNQELADHERPLKPRGRRASDLMGRFMRNNRLSPDLVLSSTAKRASETVALLLKSAGFDVEVHFYDQLYMATPTVLMETVGKLHGDKNRVLLVGHNPGLEGFLYRLTGVRESMPTAALAHILLETDKWSEVSVRQNWRLETLVRPKDLKE